MFNALNGYAVGTGTGQTVIDASRNLTNIGTYNGYVPTNSSSSTNSVISSDTRNVNTAPSGRDKGLYVDFKTQSVIGLTGSGTYAGVLTFRAYGNGTDLSGGQPIQIAYDEAGNLQTRYGSSASAWGSWKAIHVAGNNLTAGTISSGAITSSGAIVSTSPNNRLDALSIGDDSDIYLYEGSTNVLNIRTGASGSYKYFTFQDDGYFNTNSGGISTGGTARITSTGNLSNIGTISSGAITSTGDLLLDSANAEINLKSGGVGTNGAVNWTFNTTGTNYASIQLPYDTRATTGLHIDSGYPITVDATTRIDFDISGSTQMVLDTNGLKVNNYYYLDNKIMAQGTDTYLRLNQSNQFANGIWIGSSSLKSSTGYIAAGSNGGATSSRVYMYSGTYNGTNVIALDGTDGKIKGSYYAIGGTTVIDSSGNLTNIGTISSGAITAGTFVSATDYMRVTDTGNAKNILLGNQNSLGVNKPAIIQGVNGRLRLGHGNSWTTSGGTFTTVIDLENNNLNISTGALLMGSTTVIDASRNLTNIGTISSGAIDATNISVGNAAGNTRSEINTNALYTSYYNTETSPRIQLGRDVGISGGAGLALGGNNSYALIGTNNTSGSAMYFKAAAAVGSVTTNPDMTLNSSGNLVVRGTISSGAITSSGAVTAVSYGAPSGTTALYYGFNGREMVTGVDGAAYYHGSDGGGYGIVIQGGHPICRSLKIGTVNAGTTVIDTNRRLSNYKNLGMGEHKYSVVSLTAGNWYQIASGAGRQSGTFTLQDAISGGSHGSVKFYAGCSYGDGSNNHLKLIHNSVYNNTGVTDVRIRNAGTYDTMYVDVYINRTGTYYISLEDTHYATDGWALITPSANPSTSGFGITPIYDIENKLVAEANNGAEKFSLTKSGNATFAGTINSGAITSSGDISGATIEGYVFPSYPSQSGGVLTSNVSGNMAWSFNTVSSYVNSGFDRIITSTSSTGIRGESNLTYNETDGLKITDTLPKLSLIPTTSSATEIILDSQVQGFINFKDGATTDASIGYEGVFNNKLSISCGNGVTFGSSPLTTTGTISSGFIDSRRSGGNIPTSVNSNLYLVDTRSLAADTGGSIVFSSYYQGTSAVSGGSYIKGYKENANSGDYGYGLKFGVRENGQGSTGAVFTLNSTGNATFTGTISASGNITQTVAGSNYFRSIASATGNAGLFMSNTVRDWYILNNSAGTLELYDGTANAVRMSINTSGNTTFAGTISSGAITANAGTGVSSFYASHTTSHDDWQVSPISIEERGLIGAGSTSNSYSPNLNFHWNAIVSRSLTMTSDGNFTLGEWTSSGSPSLTGDLSFLNTAGYRVNNTNVIDSSRNLTNIGTISGTGISTGANLIDLFSNQNGVNELRLDNNRQDLSNVAVSKVSGRNGVEVGNMTFYRGGGGSSGFIRFQNKPTNAASLTDVFQIGDGGTVGYGVNIMAGGLRIANTTVIDSSRNLTNIGTISSGGITSSGNVTAFSDERLKDNIQTLQGSKVLEMRGVSYTKDGEASSGVIAQEIEKVAPELVHTAKDEMGTKSVAYGNLVGYLIEAIKEQQKQIDELKARLDNDPSK
jgi:hypothetical protein